MNDRSPIDPNAGNRKKSNNSSGIMDVLEQGLLLEDRHIILPWGARRLQLAEACHPDQLEQTIAWDELTWTRPVLLHGLHTQSVQVVLYPYGWLDAVWAQLEHGRCRKMAERIFGHAEQHLTCMLGQPEAPLPWDSCMPIEHRCTWQWDHLRADLLLLAADPLDSNPYSTLLHIAHRS